MVRVLYEIRKRGMERGTKGEVGEGREGSLAQLWGEVGG